MIFGNDKLGYKLAEGWGRISDGSNILDIPGIAVDSKDWLYVFSRDKQQVFIFDSEANFKNTMGKDIIFSCPHGAYIDPDDSLYLTDDDGHVVKKFSSSGKLLLTLGTGKPSDTGCINKYYKTIKRGAPPFNYPTNIAVSFTGDIFVSDGYGNARIHRFSPDGELILSWGEPGDKPAQFNLPHDIAISKDGRVYVADRENSRIQVFDQNGNFITQWPNLNRPCGLHIDKDNYVYVAEIGKRVGRIWDLDYKEGMPDFPSDVLWSRLSVYDIDGKLITRWGEADFSLPGSFFAAHGVCTDSKGDLYVAEVLKSTSEEIFSKGKLPPGKNSALQKFKRI